MDDLTGKISDILSNPESMEKLKNLAALFGQSDSGSEESEPASKTPESASPLNGLGALSSLGALSGLGGGSGSGMDTDMLQSIVRIAPLLSQFRQEDDNTRFLRALRPLLGKERQKKLDESIQMMQMLRLLPLLKGQGIL